MSELETFLTGVANAIREKKGTSEAIPAQSFANEIREIEGSVDLQPLTFTGAVEATYDGKTPVTVNIPQGGGLHEEVIFDFTTTEPVSNVKLWVEDIEKMRTINRAMLICWRLTLVGDETATGTTGTGTAVLKLGDTTLMTSTACVPSAENKSWKVGNAQGYVIRSPFIRSSSITSPNGSRPNTVYMDASISLVDDKVALRPINVLLYNTTGGNNSFLTLETSLPIGTGSRIILTVSTL